MNNLSSSDCQDKPAPPEFKFPLLAVDPSSKPKNNCELELLSLSISQCSSDIRAHLEKAAGCSLDESSDIIWSSGIAEVGEVNNLFERTVTFLYHLARGFKGKYHELLSLNLILNLRVYHGTLNVYLPPLNQSLLKLVETLQIKLVISAYYTGPISLPKPSK
jgi:hypothetical protein